MSFSHGMARGLYRGYKKYTPWLTHTRDLAVPPGKGTKETCFKIMLKILSEGKDGVPQRSELSCGVTVFLLMTMKMDSMYLYLPGTPTQRVTSTLDDVIKIQKKFDKLEKQPG